MRRTARWTAHAVLLLLALLAACRPTPAPAPPPVVVVTRTTAPIRPEQPAATDAPTITPAAVKTPTLQPSLTTAPTLGAAAEKEARFTASTMNQVPPADLIEEMDFFLGGGGGYGGCGPYSPSLQVVSGNKRLTLMDLAIIVTCNWKKDETVTVTVVDPLGQKRTITHQPKVYYDGATEIVISYQPGIDSPTGLYQFNFLGSQTVISQISFFQPSGPALYALSEDPFNPVEQPTGGRQSLLLTGFALNEVVRLFAYRRDGLHVTFSGWQDVRTGPDGRLLIETDLPRIAGDQRVDFFAYGKKSGGVKLYNPMGKDPYANKSLYCPGALKPRVDFDQQVRAARVNGAYLRIHQGPGTGSPVIEQVPEGTLFKTSGPQEGPVCKDGRFWWPVDTKKSHGWVAESEKDQYLIEPVP